VWFFYIVLGSICGYFCIVDIWYLTSGIRALSLAELWAKFFFFIFADFFFSEKKKEGRDIPEIYVYFVKNL
jgi:hypothetical protein